MSAPPEKLVRALSAGISILRYLAHRREPSGVSQIARDLGLNPSTAYNLLRTLVYERLAAFDPVAKTYGIGPGAAELAGAAEGAGSQVLLIRPFLQRLADDHGITVVLWGRADGERAVLVDGVEAESAVQIRMRIGQRLPLFIGAMGRCFAASSELDPEELRAAFARIRWQSEVTFQQYLDDLASVRRDGHAVDVGSFARGVTSVAAPIREDGKPLRLVISATCFTAQMAPSALPDLAKDVRATADEVARTIAVAH